ncbi:hypothetical protein PMAYCL1PPCAC_12445, partial [Pristionchus mayeri]
SMWPGTLPQEGKVSVEGMTCMSCVNHIQDTISAKEGILQCTVSLQTKTATVIFDGSLWNGEKVAEAIDDMGFEAKLISTKKQRWKRNKEEGGERRTRVSIKGMTCNSCVQSIQEKLKGVQGVISVKVDLQREEENIIYENPPLTGDKVVQEIDDCGFEVSLVSDEGVLDMPSSSFCLPQSEVEISNGRSTEKGERKNPKVSVRVNSVKYDKYSASEDSNEKCSIAINGMTCASCVRSIETKIGKLSGSSIDRGALIGAKAEIVYDPTLISVQGLVDAINDLGYSAVFLEHGGSTYSNIHIIVGGLDSESAVHRLESHIMARKGVESCSASIANSILTVEYSAHSVGPRDIMGTVESLGFTAELATKEDSSEAIGSLRRSGQMVEYLPLVSGLRGSRHARHDCIPLDSTYSYASRETDTHLLPRPITGQPHPTGALHSRTVVLWSSLLLSSMEVDEARVDEHGRAHRLGHLHCIHLLGRSVGGCGSPRMVLLSDDLL